MQRRDTDGVEAAASAAAVDLHRERILTAVATSVELHQDVRLRLLRKLPLGDYVARSPT